MTALQCNRLFFSILPCAAIAYFSYLVRDFQLDDALIYLRYVKNFHEGFGLVYNPGEKFNGLTSPLFTYLILLAGYVFDNLQITTITVSALCFMGAALIGGKLLASGPWEAMFTALVIGSFSYFYGTFGMETPLYLGLIGLALYLYQCESPYLVIVLAMIASTRSEGVFLALVVTVDYLWHKRPMPNLKLIAIAAFIFLLPFVINYVYYGHFVPATGNAKIGQGKSGFWGVGWIFFDLDSLLQRAFQRDTNTLCFYLGFAAYGVFGFIQERVTRVAMCFVALLLGFYGGLNIPNYHWYYAPFFYLLLIFACRGFWRLARRLLQTGWADDRAFLFLLTAAAYGYTLPHVLDFNERGRFGSYADIGLWVKQHMPDNATIAMVEIGTVGWYADRYVIDILGLVNKYNADYIGKSDVTSWLRHYQPDYILKHDPIWVFEESSKLLESAGAYAPVSDFVFPGYVLLQKTHKYSDTEIAHYFEAKG